MKHIFEAMKRIEATRIVEFNSDELALVIEALCALGEYSHAHGVEKECKALLDRIVPLRAVNETPLLYNELADREVERQLAAITKQRYSAPLISVEQVNAIMESKSKLIDQ